MHRTLQYLGPVVALAGAVLVRAAVTTGAGPATRPSMDAGGPTIEAITAPSDSRKLTFGASGLVASVPVKEGENIKKGQLLAELDNQIQKLEAKKAQIEATSTAEVDAYQADLDEKEIVYKRKTDVNSQGGYNKSEVEEAKLDVVEDEKRLQLSREKQAEAALDAQKAAHLVDQMRIVAPFDGRVLKIVVHEGESCDPQRPDGAIEVVNTDPLYVEIGELNTRQVAMLHVGQILRVRYAGDPTWHDATVILKSPVADARSDTQPVRLSMPNTDGRDAGLSVQVELPPEVAGATDHGVAGMP
jgi:membrane fusion protein, multidrug efflux system